MSASQQAQKRLDNAAGHRIVLYLLTLGGGWGWTLHAPRKQPHLATCVYRTFHQVGGVIPPSLQIVQGLRAGSSGGVLSCYGARGGVLTDQGREFTGGF